MTNFSFSGQPGGGGHGHTCPRQMTLAITVEPCGKNMVRYEEMLLKNFVLAPSIVSEFQSASRRHVFFMMYDKSPFLEIIFQIDLAYKNFAGRRKWMISE